jgi:hypothetical protein
MRKFTPSQGGSLTGQAGAVGRGHWPPPPPPPPAVSTTTTTTMLRHHAAHPPPHTCDTGISCQNKREDELGFKGLPNGVTSAIAKAMDPKKLADARLATTRAHRSATATAGLTAQGTGLSIWQAWKAA